jgi:hypothetical protein
MDLLQENALGVKVPSGETILTKYLNGYTATVVVTGNEKAALNDTTPLDAGKTEVDNDTILNWTTGLDEIGSAYTIWAVKGGAQKQDTVVYSELSADNAYYETYEATKGAISAKDAGMKLTGAETYINFADGEGEYSYTADVVITYSVANNKIALTDDIIKELKGYGYDVTGLKKDTDLTVNGDTIKAGAGVDDDTLAIIHYIFANDNNDSSKVCVGTQNTDDISNKISFSAFVKTYLNVEGDKYEVPANENGNYIKVIDNDGDGVAEYILKTAYTMDVITNIAKNGTYTLAGEYNTKTSKYVPATVAADAMSTEDELAAGDVIVYALIDGVYYANLAEVETITIAKKGIDFKAETITDGETTYEQSAIAIDEDGTSYTGAFNNAFSEDTFLFALTDATAEKTYDLYLDNYGYVRAYTLNKYTYGLGLLTNASYYTDGRKTTTAQVEMVVNPDTDSTDYDVDTSVRGWNAAGFIDEDSDVQDKGSAGTWGRLNGFVDSNATKATTFKTNIASYANNDDVLTLVEPESTDGYTNRNLTVVKRELDLSNVTSLKNTHYTTNSTSALDVYATTDTVYYYVDAATKTVKATWVGYNSAPKTLTLTSDDAAYTVATRSSDKNASGTQVSYYTANVIVIEAKSSSSALNFVYYANTNGAQQGTNESSYWAYSIALDDNGDVDTANYIDTLKGTIKQNPNFYLVANDRDNTVTALDADKHEYTANGIYAGTAQVGPSVKNNNYVEVLVNGTKKTETFQVGENAVPVYKVVKNGIKNWVSYGIEDCDTISVGDTLIYVKSGNTVLYAINVDKSVDSDGKIVGGLDTLWNTIVTDNTPASNATAEPTVTLTVNGTPYTLTAGTTKDIPYSVWEAVENGKGTITVKPADGNQIAISGETTFTSKSVTVDSEKITSAGTGSITVLTQGSDSNAVTASYTYGYKFTAAETGKDLLKKADNSKVDPVSIYDGGVTTLTLVQEYYTKSAGASWAWKFYDGNGKLIDDTDIVAIAAADHATVVVTPESGTAAEYVILFRASDDDKYTAATVEDAVAALYKAGGKTTGAIANEIYSNSNATARLGDEVILPALIKAGASAEELFKDYASAHTKDATIAKALKDAGKTTEYILTGLFDSQVSAGKVTSNSQEITRNGNTYTIKIGSNNAISGTGVYDALNAAGVTNVSYKENSGTATTKSLTDALAAVNTLISTTYTAGQGNSNTAYVTIDGTEYTLTITYPAA